MKPNYSPEHCPRCQSFQVKEKENSLYCYRCQLTFDKNLLKLLKDEDILANEELEGILNVFGEFSNPEELDDIDDLRLS